MRPTSCAGHRWRIFGIIGGLACLLASTPVASRNAGIPLYEKRTIEADGRYYLTRDIVASGVILDILGSARNVDIDLNGHTLIRTDAGPVLRALSGPTTLPRRLNIGNGKVVNGVIPPTGGTTLHIDWHHRIAIQNLETNGKITVEFSDMVRLHDISATAISVEGTATNSVTGSIEDVTLVDSDGAGLEIVYGSAMRVNGISVEHPAGDGVHLNHCDACRVEDGAVQDAGDDVVEVSASAGTQIASLTAFRGTNGIRVDSLSQGTLLDNVSVSFSTTGAGLDNGGSQTHVSRSTFVGNPLAGIVNTGSQLTLRQTVSTGNGVTDFDDTGFDTVMIVDNRIGS